MNYLTLSQRLHSEAGIAGSAPTTVVSQTGMLGRLVAWIQTAYEDIQNLHPEWLFLRTEFSFSTVSGTQNYTATTIGLTDFGSWKTGTGGFKLYSAVTDEVELIYSPWDEFRLAYKTGSYRTTSARPTVYSIQPNQSIDLWAIPDAVYTVTGEYFKEPQTMSVDSDSPIFPSAYHMILVWRALMFYGAKIGAAEVYTHGNNEYKRLLRKLELNQLPRFTWGAPLA